MPFPLRGLLLCAAVAAALGAADFTISNTFGSHMVLQRDEINPIWGWGSAGQHVQITVPTLGLTFPPVAVAADGSWRSAISSLPASFDPITITATHVESGDTITLEDVLVGDVFFCSGQVRLRDVGA